MKSKKVFVMAIIIAAIGAAGPPAISSGAQQASATVPEKEVTLISVFDNYEIDPELRTGWGLGCVVKTSRETLLFDTGGSSEILLANMAKMGIDPKSIGKVVISHIHGDHTGGLEGFLDKNSDVTVFIPDSFPGSFRNMINRKGAKFVDVSKPAKISENIFSTGELYGPPQEQSLIIDSQKGLIIVAGCAHPGIENITEKAKEIMPGKEVYLVLGGFHHPNISVVAKIRKLGVKRVAPSHCTGDPAREAFRKEYKEDFIEYGVGKTIEIKGN